MGMSLVIATYEQRGHGGTMLQQLLASITRLRRPAGDFEVVISDNSADNVVRTVCAKYLNELPIVYYRNLDHVGAAENTNHAIDCARFDKIKVMCQDDLFVNPSALTMFDDILNKHGWVVSASKIIKSTTIGRTVQPKFIPGAMDKNTVGMPSVIGFNRCDVRMDTSLKTFCDLWFYHELYFRYGMPGVIDSATVGQRYWTGSQSRNQPPSHKQDAEIMKKRYDEFQSKNNMPGMRADAGKTLPGFGVNAFVE